MISFLIALSASVGKFGSPQGCGIFVPVTIRLAPICLDTIVIEVMWAVGMPTLSISFTIAAPLRVQVPQLETRKAASIPSAFISAPISRPMRCITGMAAFTPVVM